MRKKTNIQSGATCCTLLAVIIICFLLFGGRCGSEFEILLDDKGSADPPNVLLYWTESGSGIKRILTDETVIETVVSIISPRVPLDIALDMTGRKVYWAEYSGGTTFQIRRTGLDGTGEELFRSYSGHGPTAIAIDPVAQMIYWNETNISAPKNDLLRSYLNAPVPVLTPEKQFKKITDIYTYALCLDTINRKTYLNAGSYWNVHAAFGSGNSGAVYQSEMDNDTYMQQITGTGSANPSTPFRGIAVDGSGGHVYYVDYTIANPFILSIKRANLNVQSPSEWVTAAGFSIEKIALDKKGGKIYWTSGADNSIYRADLAAPNSNVEKFLQLDGMPTGIVIAR